jgi:hypothetical protein
MRFHQNECFPGREAYETYSDTPTTTTPTITNKQHEESDNKNQLPFESPSSDSGFSSGSPVILHEKSLVQMLMKISRQYEEIKIEFNAYRETTKTVINELNDKVEALTMLVNEQKNVIHTQQRKNETTIIELSEFIVNYYQQSQLSNTIEISGLDDLPDEETVENVLQIAASVNVPLKKQQIKSINRLKNGKTSVTISEHAKCSKLISESFNNVINNPQRTTKNPKKHNKQKKNPPEAPKERIFISNALTTTNHLLYKQLRDLKKEGIINKIAFFNGIFSAHQPGIQQSTYIYHIKQLEQFTSSIST